MRVVIVGAGSIGARHAAIAAQRTDTAIADIDVDRARRVAAQTGATALEDQAALAAWRADGAIVAVPAADHADVATALLAAGTDVLVEKPLAHTVDAGAALLSAAREHGRRLYVACNMRFHPAVQALRSALPGIGEPRCARAYYGNWLPAMRPGSDYRALYCADAAQGGALLDGIHEVDYLSWLFGPVTDVLARRARLSDLDIESDDYAALLLRHESGVASEIHVDYLQRSKRRGCEIIGSRGTLLWESRGRNPERCRVERSVDGGDWETPLVDDDVFADGPYVAQFEAFRDALDGAPAGDLLDGATALAELRTVIAARSAGGMDA